MPETTPNEAWPVPLLSEPAKQANFKNLADAMEASFVAAKPDHDLALRRPVWKRRSAAGVGQTVAAGVLAGFTFATADVDTHSLWPDNAHMVSPAYNCVLQFHFTARISASAGAPQFFIYGIFLGSVTSGNFRSVVNAKQWSGTNYATWKGYSMDFYCPASTSIYVGVQVVGPGASSYTFRDLMVSGYMLAKPNP